MAELDKIVEPSKITFLSACVNILHVQRMKSSLFLEVWYPAIQKRNPSFMHSFIHSFTQLMYLLATYPSIYLSVYLSICLHIHIHNHNMYIFAYLSLSLSRSRLGR